MARTLSASLVHAHLRQHTQLAWAVAGGTTGALHVFSLSGKHLRDLRGRWRTPWLLRHSAGRLYLVEDAYNATDAPDALDTPAVARAKRQAGRRVLVISPPDGRLLQAYRPPVVRGMAAGGRAGACADSNAADAASGAQSDAAHDHGDVAAADDDDAGVIVHMAEFDRRIALAVSTGSGAAAITAFDV